jgi:hypothetical protein
MARIASFTSAGVPTGDAPDMTLDALMARQKALADAAGGISANRNMQSPLQGAAYVAEKFANAIQQRRVQGQMANARHQLAQIIGGIDPTAGPSQDQLGQAFAVDPDLGLKLMAQAVQARREAAQLAQHNAERSQDRDWQVSDTTAAAQRAEAARKEQEAFLSGQTDKSQQFQMGQQERSQTFAERQAEAARAAAAAVPKSTVGEINLDFKNGAYGDPNTPEAAALRDEAIKKANAIPTPAGVNADRKALWQSQDDYIGSTSAVSQLQRASDLLKQGIATGYTAGARTYAGNAGLTGEDEKALANRTKEFNSIMNQEAITAMSQQLKGATTDTEMARFMQNMNDPTIDPAVKQRQIDVMIARARSHNELQAARIKELGGDIPASSATNAVDPAVEATTLQDARDAIKKGAPEAMVRKRLADKGIDPGKL